MTGHVHQTKSRRVVGRDGAQTGCLSLEAVLTGADGEVEVEVITITEAEAWPVTTEAVVGEAALTEAG